MARRRRELAGLEAELVEARYLATVRYGQWAASARRHALVLEHVVDAARARVPEEMQ